MFAKVLKSATAMFLLSLISSCVSVSPMARQPLSAASTLSSRNIHFSLDLPKSNDLVTTIPPARSINTAFFFSPLFLKPEKIPVIHHPFSIFKTNYATSTQDRPLHALLCCFPTKQAPFHLPAQPSGSFPPPAPDPSSSVPRSPRLRSSLSSSSVPRVHGSTFHLPLDLLSSDSFLTSDPSQPPKPVTAHTQQTRLSHSCHRIALSTSPASSSGRHALPSASSPM